MAGTRHPQTRESESEQLSARSVEVARKSSISRKQHHLSGSKVFAKRQWPMSILAMLGRPVRFTQYLHQRSDTPLLQYIGFGSLIPRDTYSQVRGHQD